MKHLNAILSAQASPGYSIAQEGIADKVKEGFLYLRKAFNPKTKAEAETELAARLELVREAHKHLGTLKTKLAGAKEKDVQKVDLTKGLAPLGFEGKTAEDVIQFIKDKQKELKDGKKPEDVKRTEGKIVIEMTKGDAMNFMNAFSSYLDVAEHTLDKAVKGVKKGEVAMEAFDFSGLLDALLIPVKALWFVFRFVIYMYVVFFTAITVFIPAFLIVTGTFQAFYGGLFDTLLPELNRNKYADA